MTSGYTEKPDKTGFHASISNLKQVYLYRINSLNKLLLKE